MPDLSARYRGWTLAGAIQRCVDPTIVDQLRERPRAGPSKRVLENFAAARRRAEQELQDYLTAGRLVGRAVREGDTEERRVQPSEWASYQFDTASSRAFDSSGVKPALLDVRIFPVLESPDAIDLLDGKTLVEACRTFVFDDPQVLARRKWAEAVGGKPAKFGFFRPPFRSIWPVTYGRDRTWDTPIGYLYSHEKPFRPTRLADLTLEGRFSRLIEFLANGAIVAAGLSQSGSPMEVPRSVWCRDATFIDLDNGDIYEMSKLAEDYDSAFSGPTVTALILRKPPAKFAGLLARDQVHAQPKPSKAVSSVRAKSKAEEECFMWLVELMRKSPDVPTRTKHSLWEEARRRWSGLLSWQAFQDARKKAISEASALAWRVAGRPKKS